MNILLLWLAYILMSIGALIFVVALVVGIINIAWTAYRNRNDPDGSTIVVDRAMAQGCSLEVALAASIFFVFLGLGVNFLRAILFG